MNFKQTFSVMAVMLLAATACICISIDNSDAERPDHVTERSEFTDLSKFTYQSGTTSYYGTVLNPYTSVNIDATVTEKGKTLAFYVLEGSPVTVKAGGECPYGYHARLVNSGWNYSDGVYSVDSLVYENETSFYTGNYASISIYSVEKAGWITERTHFYGFCCSQQEPLIGINMETTSDATGFEEIYIAEGSLVRICGSDGTWSAQMYYGNKVGLGDYIGKYLRCDSVTVGEDILWLILEDGGYSEDQKVPFKVVQYNENFLVNFNANGGSCDLVSKRYSEDSTFSLPNATKDYSTFLGWYTEQNGGTRVGGAGDSYKVEGNVTLYAHYDLASVEILSELSEAYCIMGSSFSYVVLTNPENCTITVSGASWLEVTGHQVYGTPVGVEPGTYHITITASFGNASDSQYFDLIVVKKLDFESIPTGGIIVHPTVIS